MTARLHITHFHAHMQCKKEWYTTVLTAKCVASNTLVKINAKSGLDLIIEHYGQRPKSQTKAREITYPWYPRRQANMP